MAWGSGLGVREEVDAAWMAQALRFAKEAQKQGEVPVGAVLVDKNNTLIATGYNQPMILQDPTAHAEVLAIRAAAQKKNNYRLVDTTLYVTLEPCMMCVGALIHARIGRLVFGAYDPKSGAVESYGEYLNVNCHNHKVEYVGGVLEEPSAKLLQEFFEGRRLKTAKYL